MRYKDIIKRISIKENISPKQVESEMQAAINSAGFNCSVQEFIETTSALLIQKTIYSNLV